MIQADDSGHPSNFVRPRRTGTWVIQDTHPILCDRDELGRVIKKSQPAPTGTRHSYYRYELLWDKMIQSGDVGHPSYFIANHTHHDDGD